MSEQRTFAGLAWSANGKVTRREPKWFGLSDPGAKDAIYDSESIRRFVGVEGKAFPGSGVARDQELLALKRELAKVKRDLLVARCGSVLRERIEMKYESLQRCRGVYPIQLMCRCLKVLEQ